MALLGAFGQINNQDELQKAQQLGLLPPVPQSQGLLGRVTSTPGFWQGLSQAGQGLVAASQGRPGYKPTWAQGISAGLGGFNQGMSDYAAQQLNQRIAQQKLEQEKAGGQWNTDTANRYRIHAERLKAQAKKDGIELGDDQAIQMAAQYVDNLPYDSRRALADLQQQYDLAKLDYQATAAGKAERAKIEAQVGMTPAVAKSQADIAGAVEGAKAGATNAAETQKQLASYSDVESNLAEMERLANEGIYTGGVLDKAGRGFASAGVGSGLLYDQNKANNTINIRQIAANLKFSAKPPGMGAMSDSEWKLVQSAIPDPESTGDVSQLLSGIKEARRRIEAWKASRAGNVTATTPNAPQKKPSGRTEADILKKYGVK